MIGAVNAGSRWIGGPFADLAFFAFAWVPLVAAFEWSERAGWGWEGREALLLTVLAVNFIHRHLTLPLVYADPEQLRARPVGFTVLPIVCLAATLTALLVAPRTGFLALLGLSVAWTIYHTLMQKVGLLRIYSRKGGAGGPWLDRLFVFAWLGALFFVLASNASVLKEASDASAIGERLAGWLEPAGAVLPWLAGAAVLGASAVTALFIREEARGERGWNAPKLLFAASILGLYGVFLWDFVAAYAVFGFSHAVEYIAFVTIYAGRKFDGQPETRSPIAHAARWRWISMPLFAAAMVGAFFAARRTGWIVENVYVLDWYIVGSSFLHFVYDGWIWKVRRPEVAKPLEIA